MQKRSEICGENRHREDDAGSFLLNELTINYSARLRTDSWRRAPKRTVRGFIIFGLLSFLFLFLMNPLGTGRAYGQAVSGRFVTSFYSYQQYDTTDAARLDLRGFEAMQLNFGAGNYQLHTYILATNDFVTPLPNDPLLRAGNLYLEARNIANVVDLKLGRQPIFSKVGVSSFDGLSADAKFLNNQVCVVAFGGALPPVDERFELNSDLKNNTLYGGQVYYSPIENFRVGGAYVDKNFKPPSYYAYRLTDLHNTPSFGDSVYIDPSATAYQFVSGDILYYNNNVTGYVRIDYDLNFADFNRTEFSFRYSPITSLSANVEYFHRDARLPFNSIFSVFDHAGTDEYDLGLNYRLTNNVSAFTSVSKVYYTGDNSTQYSIGTNIYLFSVNFSHNDGFAGNLNGLNAQFMYPMFERRLVLIASASAMDYKILQESSLPTNRLYPHGRTQTYRPIDLLSFNLQGQYYQNPVYKNDVRGYLQVNYYFFKSFDSN
ncbi:MAG: hypothetical protein M1469_06440 [Bacteroidetes bacterium]|nr:hypothetical protein [Bacteroidota bacterium]